MSNVDWFSEWKLDYIVTGYVWVFEVNQAREVMDRCCPVTITQFPFIEPAVSQNITRVGSLLRRLPKLKQSRRALKANSRCFWAGTANLLSKGYATVF